MIDWDSWPHPEIIYQDKHCGRTCQKEDSWRWSATKMMGLFWSNKPCKEGFWKTLGIGVLAQQYYIIVQQCSWILVDVRQTYLLVSWGQTFYHTLSEKRVWSSEGGCVMSYCICSNFQKCFKDKPHPLITTTNCTHFNWNFIIMKWCFFVACIMSTCSFKTAFFKLNFSLHS